MKRCSRSRVARALAPLSTLLAIGCASVGRPPPSGFLADYADFAPDPNDESLLWWEREDFDWTRYRGLIIEPVSIYFHPEARDREIRPDELKKLTDEFRAAVVEQLGDAYPIVADPAPGILRVRSAITDVIPVRPALNALTSAVGFVAVDVGGASIEVEFLDSVSGERLAAGVDQKLGSALGGPASLARLGQARAAFDNWAKELRAALETNP